MEISEEKTEPFNWEKLSPMQRIHAMLPEEQAIVLGMFIVPELSSAEIKRRNHLFESVFGNSEELNELKTNLSNVEEFSSLLFRDLEFEKAKAQERKFLNSVCKLYSSGIRIFHLVSSSHFNLPTPEIYKDCFTRLQFSNWKLNEIWGKIPFEKRLDAYNKMNAELLSQNLISQKNVLNLEKHHYLSYLLDQLAYEAGKQYRQGDYRLGQGIDILERTILNVLPSMITDELKEKRTVVKDHGITSPLDSQYFSLLESLPREITKRKQIAVISPKPKSLMRPFWQTFRMLEDGTITNVVYGQYRHVYKTDHPEYERILNKLLEEYPELRTGKVCGFTMSESGKKEYL